MKTVWCNIKKKAGVIGRGHDTRHTPVTELSESGAGDQTIMDTAGHVSSQMLARYSHIRMQAKRKALETIVRKPGPAPQATQRFIAAVLPELTSPLIESPSESQALQGSVHLPAS